MNAGTVGADLDAVLLLGALISGKHVDDVPDWERLHRRATEERLAPLLFWKLRHDERVPERTRNELRKELYRAEASNLVLYRSLCPLLERSARAGLTPPILLKGGALATSEYEEIGLRPMSDIDVLVPREELSAWLGTARELSFHELSPKMAPGLSESVHYQVALEGGPTGDAMVEIHFGLIGGASDWRTPVLDWFFEHTEPWNAPPSICESRARQLDPTAHVLYLSAHALLQHGGAQARGIWFYDIHLLLSRSATRVVWDELFAKARELHWDAALAGALARVQEIFGTPVPEGFIERLELGATDRARRYVERRAEVSLSRAELVWSDLAAVPVRDRIRWGFSILFPRPPYMRWRYPGAGRFWPLCYPYRCGVTLWEGAGALLRRARG
jgi:hypothetical protein